MCVNSKTEFIHVIDDDTIPGNRWIENCLATMEEVGDGILSTRGVIMSEHDTQYPMPNSYTPVGWCDPNEESRITSGQVHYIDTKCKQLDINVSKLLAKHFAVDSKKKITKKVAGDVIELVNDLQQSSVSGDVAGYSPDWQEI